LNVGKCRKKRRLSRSFTHRQISVMIQTNGCYVYKENSLITQNNSDLKYKNYVNKKTVNTHTIDANAIDQ